MILKIYLTLTIYWFIVIFVTAIKKFIIVKGTEKEWFINPFVDIFISIIVIALISLVPIYRLAYVIELNKED